MTPNSLPLAASLAALAIGLGGGYLAAIEQARQQEADRGGDHWLEEAGKYFRLYAQDDRYLTELSAEEARNMEGELGAWLGRELRIPDLSGQGLTFRGARLVALEADPSALKDANPALLLVYDQPEGRPLGLCLLASGKAAKETQGLAQEGDMNQFHWIHSGYSFVLQGWADEELLREVSSEIALQLGDV